MIVAWWCFLVKPATPGCLCFSHISAKWPFTVLLVMKDILALHHATMTLELFLIWVSAKQKNIYTDLQLRLVSGNTKSITDLQLRWVV